MMKGIFTAILATLSFMPVEAQNITEITPGKVWADNNGKHINAHGGGIIEYNGRYYWYGENRPEKGFTTEVGIEVFSSDDLMNWKDEGWLLLLRKGKAMTLNAGVSWNVRK